MSFISDIFGGIGDFAAAKGDKAEESAYNQAATLANENTQQYITSTNIQEAQQTRLNTMTSGQNQAAAANNGLAPGGSAAQILNATHQQGELAKQVISVQGQINENASEQQAAAYTGQAQAAKAAASQSNTSGIGGILGGIAGIFGL